MICIQQSGYKGLYLHQCKISAHEFLVENGVKIKCQTQLWNTRMLVNFRRVWSVCERWFDEDKVWLNIALDVTIIEGYNSPTLKMQSDE